MILYIQIPALKRSFVADLVFAERWTRRTKMAAFVAKQMVGNKLNAVKGEFLYIGKFVFFYNYLVFFWPSRISLICNFLGQVINYRSPSFYNTKVFDHHNAFYGIKETGQADREIETSNCYVRRLNAITMAWLTGNLLIHARKSLILVSRDQETELTKNAWFGSDRPRNEKASCFIESSLKISRVEVF